MWAPEEHVESVGAPGVLCLLSELITGRATAEDEPVFSSLNSWRRDVLTLRSRRLADVRDTGLLLVMVAEHIGGLGGTRLSEPS